MSKIRKALREWDPQARHETPESDRIERERARLIADAHERERDRPALRAPRGLRWATAAALVLVAVVAVFRTKAPHPVETPPEPDRAPESVQWQMTASNGVRIYWNLTLFDTTGDDR